MKYAKVKENSKEYNLFHKVFHNSDAWVDKKDFIQSLLGLNLDNWTMDDTELIIDEVPDNLINQFKLVGNSYKALPETPVYRKYIKIIDRLGLKEYSISDLYNDLGWGNEGYVNIRNVYDTYYIETRDRNFNMNKNDFLEEISEGEFNALIFKLRLKSRVGIYM